MGLCAPLSAYNWSEGDTRFTMQGILKSCRVSIFFIQPMAYKSIKVKPQDFHQFHLSNFPIAIIKFSYLSKKSFLLSFAEF